jgi:UDP-glucose 4-epimerase
LKAVVTGGAGFIGSSLCEALVGEGWDVIAYDNMSVGRRHNLSGLNKTPRTTFKIVSGDCTRIEKVSQIIRDCDAVFHFAANPEVRMELNNPSQCFRQNVYATYCALEAFAASKAKIFVFASTSAVYGDAKLRPTSEDYAPMEPISIYAGSKLAGEAMVSSYCHTFNKQGIVLRFANVLGPRSTHGVVRDFVTRLVKNPRELQILGDGQQVKSYTYIDDCANAIMLSLRTSGDPVQVFNVGSEDQISAIEIGRTVVDAMDLKNVKFKLAGGLSDGRGWVGDVKNMLLDISRLKTRGWRPTHDSRESVRLTVQALVAREQ